MAFRLSTGLRNFMLQRGSFRDALYNGEIKIYSGTQPSSADAAPTGTHLCTITASSLARTAEVLATGSVTLNSGASGSVDSITVDGVGIMDNAVPFNGTLDQTAVDVAAEINKSKSSPEYRASASGAVITIEALPGAGASANGFVVASTVTTLTKTDANMAGGVDATNGLRLGDAGGGTLVKDSAQNWTGIAVATGTAGWFRMVGSVSDSELLDGAETELRIDGAIATSGGELGVSSTSIVSGATQTVSSFAVNIPAS